MFDFKGKLWTIQYPSGRWGFVGHVPMQLAHTALDGSPLDTETANLIQRHGPGMFKSKAKSVAFDTEAEAIAAATALGLTVEPTQKV
jgi:hypothetical protein